MSSFAEGLTPEHSAPSGSYAHQASPLSIGIEISHTYSVLTCLFSPDILPDIHHLLPLVGPHVECPLPLNQLRVPGQAEVVIVGDPQSLTDIVHQLVDSPRLVHIQRTDGVVGSLDLQHPQPLPELDRVLDSRIMSLLTRSRSGLSSHPGLEGSISLVLPDSGLQVEPDAGLGSRFFGHKEAVVTDRAQLGEVSGGLQLLQQLSQDIPACGLEEKREVSSNVPLKVNTWG